MASLIVEFIDTKSFMFLKYEWTAWKMLIYICAIFSIGTTYWIISFSELKKELKKINNKKWRN